MREPTDPPVILVVDDEALLRMYAADLLSEAGYRVIEASDASSALKILGERHDVRLLFTDVQMPGGCDGMELAAKVHAQWPRVLLLVTSGRLAIAEEDIADHGRFVAKPYPARTLLKKVNSLIADQDSGALE